MSVYVYPAAIAALAVVVFAARRPIRRLYAPPHGRRSLALTWLACLGAAGYGWSLGPANPFLGLGLLTGGAFIGILATVLRKEERNRADGLPDDYTAVPERVGWRGRLAFGAAAAGSVWLANAATGGGSPGDVLNAWGFVAIAALLGAAALTGRPSKGLRRHLGAELTPAEAEELRRRSLAHRRDPGRAIPLDEAQEQIERKLR